MSNIKERRELARALCTARSHGLMLSLESDPNDLQRKLT